MNLDLIRNFEPFAERFVTIRNKAQGLQTLTLNATQRYFLAQAAGHKRVICLKFRQPGISTVIGAGMYHRLYTQRGRRSVIIGHESEATRRLMERVTLMHEHMPVRPATKYASKNELVFQGTGSTLYIGTAGGRSFGRGDTVHEAHCSEFAFWPKGDEILKGLSEAVPAEGQIWIETTPNGFNHFAQMVNDARVGSNGYKLIFLPWYVHDEYVLADAIPDDEWTEDEKALATKALALAGVTLTGGQVAWRRNKQRALSQGERDTFLQEYPEDEYSCFLASGRPRFDLQALNGLLARCVGPMREVRLKDSQLTLRVWAEPETGEHYIIGADSSEGMAAGDNDAACVLHWGTGRKVASLHGKASVFGYADALADLGRSYNNAVLAVERNHPGPAVVARLGAGGYPNLWRMRREDGTVATEIGWSTNAVSRPLAIAHLDALIVAAEATKSIGIFPDKAEVGELMQFVMSNSDRAEAAAGAHDDLVMARAIAEWVRKQWQPPRAGQQMRAVGLRQR